MPVTTSTLKQDRLVRQLRTLFRSLSQAMVQSWWHCAKCGHERRAGKTGTVPVCAKCVSSTGQGELMELALGVLILPPKRRRRRRRTKHKEVIS